MNLFDSVSCSRLNIDRSDTASLESRSFMQNTYSYVVACPYPLFISEAEFLYYVLIYAFIVLKMHNNAYPTYIHTYIHIITHITHV